MMVSSKLYPDPNPKKEDKTQVMCLLCGNLDPYDKELHSYCVTKKKNIQPDEVTKDRICRRFIPK